MAYFALVSPDGVVLDVIAISNDEAPDPAPGNSEYRGRTYIASPPPFGLGKHGHWVQTSYNGTIRKQYCGPGYTYDASADVFVAPQPHPSWTLDSNHDWQPPTPQPDKGGPWAWDEETLSWVEVTPAS